ncbi:MAG TPA: class I SAM-dependent methyltransferase [Inquilinus sp.]
MSSNTVPPDFGRRLRRWRLGLATLFGRQPKGFFIPCSYADEVPDTLLPYAGHEALFRASEPVFQAVLDVIEGYRDGLLAIGATERESPPPQPRWNQGWFARLDAAAAYAMVRARQPARIVEVGSGHSTRFMIRAAVDGDLALEFTAIDPAPRASIAELGITHLEQTVQEAGTEPYRDLAEGDILFIDSSHIAMPGTDVDFLVNRVLPCLAPGVLVHIHDICLPNPYPDAWGWRGYNEQQLVAALLTGGGFKPVFASHYAATRMAEAVSRTVIGQLPLRDGTPETSLWLEKAAQPLAYL